MQSATIILSEWHQKGVARQRQYSWHRRNDVGILSRERRSEGQRAGATACWNLQRRLPTGASAEHRNAPRGILQCLNS